jgi:two-component system, NtrC family, response regulator AtoC
MLADIESELFASGHGAGPVPEAVVFGRSDAMETVRQIAEKIAPSNLPILILGESGTGKEVLAKLIHSRSQARNGPFVKINCPALPSALLESELFGYEKGAFTGAYESKRGWIELAQGGTLFLDEIAELDLALQAKLLHWLQDGLYCRLGGEANRQTDVRVLCATNRVLQHEVAAGTFRQDLFYRINVVSIQLPALRERRADIPQLAQYLIEHYNQQYKCYAQPFSSGLLQLLLQHDWPGNIRELENLIKRYVILGSEEAIASELLREGRSHTRSTSITEASLSLKQLTRHAVRDLERNILLEVLHANNWNRKETARKLKISYRALFYKLKQAGVPQKKSVEGQLLPSTIFPRAAEYH